MLPMLLATTQNFIFYHVNNSMKLSNLITKMIKNFYIRQIKMKFSLFILLILLVSSVAFPSHNINSSFQKGISFTGWDDANIYNSPISDFSLVELRKTGANYVALTTAWFKNSSSSTFIYPDKNKSPSDTSVIHAINKIHSLGMKVMLKPHLKLQNHDWCAHIRFNEEAKWKAWFKNYKNFICHYAHIAEENGVEEFCIGVELRDTMARNEWVDIIKAIRENFSGKITYASNWDNYMNIKWWNMLDFIGIDAYFPLTNKKNATMDELLDGWKRWYNEIKEYSENIGKKIIFTEIGYCSQDGTNMQPSNPDLSNKVDLQE